MQDSGDPGLSSSALGCTCSELPLKAANLTSLKKLRPRAQAWPASARLSLWVLPNQLLCCLLACLFRICLTPAPDPLRSVPHTMEDLVLQCPSDWPTELSGGAQIRDLGLKSRDLDFAELTLR